MEFKRKLMNQTWENDKKNKLILGPILQYLAQIAPPPPEFFFVSFPSTIC